MKRLLLALIALLVMSASAQESLTADQQKGKEYWDKAQVAYKGKDYKKAFKNYKKSAELGYNKGCYELAECYIGGIGTDTDYHKAIEWYRKAADLGFDQAQVYNDLGISNYHLKNYQEANRYFKMSLEGGDAWGGWNLAQHYFNGTGVQKDEAEAARLFARAVVCEKRSDNICKKIVNDDNKYFYYINGRWANASFNKRVLTDFHQKYPEAAFALDYAHWRVNPNIERPFEHFFSFKTPEAVAMVRQCADKGNRWAQFRIADLQWSGEAPNALPQDRDAAIAFWEKNSNDEEARKNLAVASLEGFYTKPIPQEWIDKDRSVSDLLRNTETLKKGVANGNREAAKALDDYARVRKNDSDILLLLDNAAKTGYDKYAEDVKLINMLYQEAEKIALSGKEISFWKGLQEDGKDYKLAGFPSAFVDFYSKYPKYDKQGILKKARLLSDFISVNGSLYSLNKEPYANGVETRMMGLVTVPKWETDAINYWFEEMDNAIAACSKYASGTTMHSFFKKSLPKLKEKLANADSSIKRQRQEYEAEVRKQSSGSSSGSSSSSRSSSSSSSRSSSSASSSSSVDIENIGMPNYRWDGDWRKDSYFPGEAAENKTGENQKRDIRFDDADNGKIYRVIGSDGYWTSSSKRYRTLDDAIIAEYVYQKYGKTRQKGRY